MRDSDNDFFKLVDTLKLNYEVIDKRYYRCMNKINAKPTGLFVLQNDIVDHNCRDHSPALFQKKTVEKEDPAKK